MFACVCATLFYVCACIHAANVYGGVTPITDEWTLVCAPLHPLRDCVFECVSSSYVWTVIIFFITLQNQSAPSQMTMCVHVYTLLVPMEV